MSEEVFKSGVVAFLWIVAFCLAMTEDAFGQNRATVEGGARKMVIEKFHATDALVVEREIHYVFRRYFIFPNKEKIESFISEDPLRNEVKFYCAGMAPGGIGGEPGQLLYDCQGKNGYKAHYFPQDEALEIITEKGRTVYFYRDLMTTKFYGTSYPDADDIKVRTIYHKPDVLPQFKGGEAALDSYYREHLIHPPLALENKIEGKIAMRVRFDKDGKIIEAETLRGIGVGCDEVAVGVMLNMPAWEPGKHNGKAVMTELILEVPFRLPVAEGK